jgi:Uma2 family endonuclease
MTAIAERAAIGGLKQVQKRAPIHRKLPSTFEEYLEWRPKDGYYYEWAYGKLLKIDSMIYPEQFHIVNNLTRLFNTTEAYREGGAFQPETRMNTMDKRARVPDISFWTLRQQRELAAKRAVVSAFIVEIISSNDTAYDVETKMDEYFSSGVQMVWHVFPNTERIYIYTSPDHNQICRGETICSAEEIISGFSIKAKDVFKLP